MSIQSEFADWKANPVTKQVFLVLQTRENDIKDQLAESAGIDNLQDRYFAGYLAAIRDVVKMSVEDVNE